MYSLLMLSSEEQIMLKVKTKLKVGTVTDHCKNEECSGSADQR